MPNLSRREMILSGAAALAAPPLLHGFTELPGPTRIYVGTNESGAGKGILVADWSESTGQIAGLGLAAEVAKPAFLAIGRQGPSTFLYAVSEVDAANAAVSAFAVERGERKLRPLNQMETGGSGPTHLSVSPDGRTVVVANYGGGSVTSFRTGTDGSLQQRVSHEQYTGSGPYKGRQERPHTHSAAVTPDGRSVLVNDLGIDRIFVYALDPATSAMRPATVPYWSAKPGSGPRHIAFSPKGDLVYSTDELVSAIETLRWDAKARTLTFVGAVSTLPAEFPANKAFVGEVAASRDGRNVYAGNRVADDTIAVFATDVPHGGLRPIEFAPSGGVTSRHIALDPSDRWMVVSHQKSDDLTVLARDVKTGRLSAPIHSIPAPSPMCVVFV